MGARRALAVSVVVATALIPLALWLGHERAVGCEHPARFPCDPRSVQPGWFGPVLGLLILWIVVVGLAVALTTARKYGRAHDGQARVVARALRWSAAVVVGAMPIALWLGRTQRVGCEPPVYSPCDPLVQRAHPWAGTLFFVLCVWFLVAVVFVVVVRPDPRFADA